MRRSLALLASLAILLSAPFSVLSQSSPYAGIWNGTQTVHMHSTCTCTGTGCVAPNFTSSCDLPLTWSGEVDFQGALSVRTGAGSITCADGWIHSFEAMRLSLGNVASDGTVPRPASSTSLPSYTSSCPAYSISFSLSPATVSFLSSCATSYSSWFVGSGFQYFASCSGETQTVLSGARTASYAPPPFQMTVSSNVTSTTATATAQVQPPPQLVGRVASVYVFAHARQSTLVPKRAMLPEPPWSLADSGPDPCVLAQLNSNGQLAPAGASTLQPYATGLIGSQSQSVTILDNVSTPNVAGASFYVGYGATPDDMFASGDYQGAVSVQGTNACTAALLTSAAPNAPSSLSGLWWNRGESGWGVSFTQRRNILFAAWYTYDASGNPKWYVASNCEMPSGVTGTSGTCSGTLYEVNGPIFFGAPFDASLRHVAAAGTLTVAFQDANTATMTYIAGGQSRSVPITRQMFQSGSAPPAVDYTDLWWNPSESGWGMAITQQYGMMFLAWYVYDASGRPMWYVASDCAMAGSGCSGVLYQTTGPALGSTFDPGAVRVATAGTVTLSFTDANTAQLSYTVNGVTAVKTITRQLF